MASTIKLKSSTTAGNAPSSLETGEFAINVKDGNLFYGSSSAVKQHFIVDELEVKGNLTAQQYIVSSSVTYMTQSFSSGSTIFGDTLDDTHQFTGSILITGSITASTISASYIDLDPLANGDIPAHKEGRIYYNTDEGALTVYNNEADISLQVGQEFWIKCQNATHTEIPNGTPVKITGASGDNVLVSPAIAENHATGSHYENHIIGLATHNIPGNGQGYVTTAGTVREVDTSDFSAGDSIYLQTGSAGLRNIPPPFPYDVVVVGYVQRVHSNNGEIFVMPKQPSHIGTLSGVSGSNGHVGDLWVYQDNDAWAPSKTLSGSYTIDNGNLNVDGAVTGSALQLGNLGAANEILIVGANTEVTSSNLLAIDTVNERVGIGTTSPGEKLEVVGNISSSGDILGNHYKINGNSLANTSGTTTLSIGATSFYDKINLGKPNSTTVQVFLPGQVTASGDISASGTITAATLDAASVSDALAAAIVAEIDNDEIPIAKLAEDAVTVTAGTNLGGGGSVTLGGSITLNVDDAFIKNDADDATTGILTAAGLKSTTHITSSGNISASGTVTANSLVGTLGTAAQTNITSLGTLTTLTVDNLNLNSNTLSSTSDTDVFMNLGTAGFGFEANAGDKFIFNANQNNVDLHYAGENDANVFYIDASADKVGIGDATPTAKLDVAGDINTTSHITASGNISASGTVTANSLVGTLGTAAQTNITSLGTLTALTMDGTIDMNGETLNLSAGEIDNGATIKSLVFGSTTDNDLTITSDGNITFKLDDDNDETGQSFSFKNDNTEIANLNESGDLQLDGHITASGNISASGTIFTDTLSSPSNDLQIPSDTVTITAGTAGDANLILHADTDNNDENDNPYMYYKQDGDGGVFGIIGLSGANDKWPDGTTLTGATANGMVIGMTGSASGTARQVTIAAGNSASIIVKNDADVQILESLIVDNDIAATGGTSNFNVIVSKTNKLSKTSTVHGNHQGDVVFFGGTTSMDVGQIYNLNGAGGWTKAQANSQANSDALLAVALGDESDNDGMLLKGMVTLDHDPGTIGDPLYLSDGTAGQATSTAPNSTNDIVRLIGYCVDSTNGQIYFNPSNDFIKHA